MGKTCHDLTSFMCSFRLRSSLRSRPFASRTSWLLVVHVHVIGRAIRACLHVAPYLMREAIGGHRRQSAPPSTWHRTSSVEPLASQSAVSSRRTYLMWQERWHSRERHDSAVLSGLTYEHSQVVSCARCAIRCNQVQSGAIRCNQFNYEHSQVVSCARACIERAPTVEGDRWEIGGNQRQPHLRVGNQRQLEAIRGNQRQPHLRVGIERARGVEVDTQVQVQTVKIAPLGTNCHQTQSDAIRRNQRPLRANQTQSEVIQRPA